MKLSSNMYIWQHGKINFYIFMSSEGRNPLNFTYRARTARWGRTIVSPGPRIFLFRFRDVEDTVLNFPREKSSRVAKFGGADYSFSG